MADTSTGENVAPANTAKPLPEVEAQVKVSNEALASWLKIATELEAQLPPDGAKLNSPEMNGSPAGKLQKAFDTLCTVFARKANRSKKPEAVKGKKADPDKDNPAHMLEADRKLMIKAARDFIKAARDCGAQIEAMESEVELAELRTLSEADQKIIAKHVRELRAKDAKTTQREAA